MHIHVTSAEGEAKFWIEPVIALADYSGFASSELKKLQKIIEEHGDEIRKAWKKHFKS